MVGGLTSRSQEESHYRQARKVHVQPLLPAQGVTQPFRQQLDCWKGEQTRD